MDALITRSDLLILKDLSCSTELVSVENIPHSFKDDFDNYFFGKTLVKKNGHLFAYPGDIKRWVSLVFDTYKN